MKKWSDNETLELINLIKEGKGYKDISILLNRSVSSIRNKVIKNNFLHYRKTDNVVVTCKNCNNIIDTKDKKRLFCNNSCSAIYNNKKRKNKTKKCANCGEVLNNHRNKFCSRKCQTVFYRNKKIERWLSGEINGICGEYQTSRYIKGYLIKKYGEKCMDCGWNKRNPYTNKIPIELEHIDGDFKNNKEENLKLVCPNCHSLTKTYKGANRGKGRNRKKYY